MPGPQPSHSRDPPAFIQATRRPGIKRDPAYWRLCGYRHNRHRFAVNTLIQWYRAHEDIERRLPVLSTFLGHAHVADTYWYLSMHPELMRLATSRLERRWGLTHED